MCRIKDRERRRAEGEKPAPFGGVRNTGPQPPAHPFSVSEARNAGLLVESRRILDSQYSMNGENQYMMNNRRFVNGYEIRKFPARAVAELKDPPFQDVQHFVDVGVGGDAGDAQRTLLDAASAGTARQFAVGDTVLVAKGDLKSMRGHVVEIDESRSRVVLQPIGLDGFTEKLDFDMADLQKQVMTGARVKVRLLTLDSPVGTPLLPSLLPAASCAAFSANLAKTWKVLDSFMPLLQATAGLLTE